MAVKFNPFSGQLQIDEKGASASYIDGEVATYNDLPLSSTTAPLDSAWLVRSASGVWPVSRKQAGIYIRTATGGSSRDADWTYAGTMPDVFSDANFTIYDDADTSKNLKFQLSGITTGTTRTLTAPNASGTIARTEDFAAPPAIGSTTAASGAFTTLSANNGTITASAPVLDLSQTWNNAAVTFTGLRFNATDTASAAASNLAEFQLSGTALAAIRKDGSFRVLGTGDRTVLAHPNFALSAVAGGAWLGVNTTISLSSAGNFVTAGGLIRLNDVTSANPVELNRDAADTLAQRRTTNPQAFRLYNTTDAGLTNFERGFMRWSSNVLQIGTEKLGTGSARALEFQTDGTTRVTISSTGDLTVGGFSTFSNNVNITSGRVLSANQINLNNTSTALLALGTDSTIRWGSSSATTPMLKRSSTTLQVRLADDSAYSVLDAQLRAQGTAPATSGATGTAGDIRYDADYIYVCTAANTWKRAAIATW